MKKGHKSKRGFTLLALLVVVVGFPVSAHATLILRGTDTLGNRLIYDDDLNITWYDYSNAPNTWQNQVNWANALTVNFRGNVYDDWRLPIIFDYSCWHSYNCTNSEMGHLYYTELGNSAGGLTNTGDFHNLTLVPYVFHFSGTEFSLVGYGYPPPGSEAWYFGFTIGYQASRNKGDQYYALAVRPGDSHPSSVPEPGPLLLLGSGLAGLAAWRLGRKRG